MSKAAIAVRPLGPVRYEGLVEYLRSQIRSGALATGDRLPSFTELQSQFGAAPSTVNRALIALEQDGLIIRERRKGVFVADTKARPRQHAIGVLGLDQKAGRSPYILHLMEGIQAAAHREEMDVMLLNPDSRRGLEKIDGVLLHGEDADGLYASLPHGIPAVAMMQTAESLPSVVADDFGGMRAATEYLISLGHRRIACLVFKQSPVIQRRLGGYRAALEAAGIRANENWVRDIMQEGMPTLRAHAATTMTRWLADGWRKSGCTAILCQNDSAASGVLQALREAGLRVPEDVSVIGFDSTEECEHTTPRLTSVQVPLEEIGRHAARLLLEQIHEKEVAPVSTVLPVRLEIRDSTAPVT